MYIEDTVFMKGSPRRVYELAAAVERWPQILPHYRYVRLHSYEGNRKIVSMSAWRDFVPTSWKSIQELDPERLRIRFRHIGGFTRGMDVEWRIEPQSGGARVTIAHDWHKPWPLIGEWVSRMVCDFFVHNIADKTLRRISELVELEQREQNSERVV